MKYSYDGSVLKSEKAGSVPAAHGEVPVVARTLRWRLLLSYALAFSASIFGAIVVWWIFSPSGRDMASGGEDVVNAQIADAGPETPEKNTGDGRGRACKVNADSALEYLTPSEAEIRQLYGYVASSPVVSENLQYRDRMDGMKLVYVPTNDIVNAVARRRVHKAKDGKVKILFDMAVYGGATRYARLVGLAAAQEESGIKGALRRLVEKMPRRLCSQCTETDALKVVENAGLAPALADPAIRQKAVSYSSGMLIGVLAHEVGHHSLGHLLAFEEKTNLEIARNREREADSFASSVISASPFGEYIFAGTLFWHYAVAMQSDADSDAGLSHPLSRERFENFVRSNRDKAAAMGIVLEK